MTPLYKKEMHTSEAHAREPIYTHAKQTHSFYFLLPEENLWLNRINMEKPNEKVKRTISFLCIQIKQMDTRRTIMETSVCPAYFK